MLRLTEVALFLSPFALFAVWWFGGRRLGVLAWPAIGLAVGVAVLLISFGLRRSMPRDAIYVPARVEGSRIVDGHAR